MHRLVPFSSQLDIQLEARASRDSNQFLKIAFKLRGELSQIVLPEIAEAPCRADELWKHTCFEVFFGPQHGPNYWEINLSSSGDWNVYSFENYRTGMKTEDGIPGIFTRQQKEPTEFSLEVEIDLSPLSLAGKRLKLSTTTVIEQTTGEISFWALKHAGKNPDFHLRESFTEEV